MKTVTTIGIDIAKSVFQVHGIDDAGKPIVRRQLRRGQMIAFFSKLPVCLIGIEACASSHYWARELMLLGHDVRLMPPAYVKPYVKRQKNDANDAEAICEAVQRPSMRFVPVKSPEQQSGLVVHRTRRLLVRQQTSLMWLYQSDVAYWPGPEDPSESTTRLKLSVELKYAIGGLTCRILRRSLADHYSCRPKADATVGDLSIRHNRSTHFGTTET